MYLQLASHIRVGLDEEGLSVGFGSRQLHFAEHIPEILTVLADCLDAKTEEEIQDLALRELGTEAEQVVKALLSHNVLTASIERHEGRYSRPHLYYTMNGQDPIAVQKLLSQSRVTLVGAGGIGTHLATMLCTHGVGEIDLVDEDTIELSNLTRQWPFKEEDIGKKKVDALAHYLRERNSDCRINTASVRIVEANVSKALGHTRSLVVASADENSVARVVQNYCIDQDIPYINVGYVNDIPVWGPFYIPGRSGCLNCLPTARKQAQDPIIDKKLKEINQRYRTPSYGPTNATAASLASYDIISFLGWGAHPKSHGRRIGLYPETMTFSYLQAEPERIKCRCQKH